MVMKARKLKQESMVESSTVSLRNYAKQRILKDMISSVKNNANFSSEYIIMILDQSSVKVFSSCCKWFELY